MLKAVIFDMDGVIIDSEPFHVEVETQLHKQLGIYIEPEIRKGFVGIANKRMWSYIKENYGLTQSVDELITWAHAYRFENFSQLENLVPIKGIPELLADLKQNKILTAIASSSPPKVIDLFMDKLQLGHYFDAFISGDRVAEGKPAPDIFLEAASTLNVNTTECVVIEDAYNGVKAAKSAGMHCIAYINPTTPPQDLTLADVTIDTFTTLSTKKINELFF